MTSRIVQLRDGSTVTIRPATSKDEVALRAFLMELCPESRRLRFFTGAADLGRAAHWGADMGADRYGLVALDQAGTLVGHALYVQLSPICAEVAVEVADRFHGLGLGTILVQRLAAAAERRGIVSFVAEVLPENRAMLDVFRDGFHAHVRLRGGTDTVAFPTAAWRLVRERPGANGPRPAGANSTDASQPPSASPGAPVKGPK
jgi:GNAT superfamily N-acetyltransferase